ncbi:hypothetical protein PGTUg99_037544 [Puccinia graminis f. sp. tritici]|uniref:Peptidase A2 domain-containing protein n=1 Tax=Puccinia graminis f. sp. tritici TaxID=56615 RepID=A0A5B0RBH9_PUCGR|nr:hypothetical protein PGTUg99_037544 [Puccinia graminis f. sp. tritici]
MLWPPFSPQGLRLTFAGAYESDPAVRKRHEVSKPYKAPATPPASARWVPKKASPAPASSEPLSDMEPEMELFDRTESTPEPEASGSQEPSQAAQQPKPSGSQQKVRFERGVSREHPDAAESVLKKISDLSVPGVTVSELMAISPTVAEGMKKWVSRRRVEIGSEELKVHSGTLVEGKEAADLGIDPKLYLCPLGYLSCFIGEDETLAAPLVDSGSQLNLISDSLAIKFNLSPRVNFTSAVYGINNQACELMGVAEDVPIRIGKTIIQSCHFWITRNDGPLILGRPFLMDIGATLAYSSQSGEKLIIPDAAGRNIEVSLCSTETGRWERDFPGQGRRAVLRGLITASQPPTRTPLQNGVQAGKPSACRGIPCRLACLRARPTLGRGHTAGRNPSRRAVYSPAEGFPSAGRGTRTSSIRRKPFRWTRYMYLVHRKETLPLDEVHVPRPSEGNPSALDEVHVPRPAEGSEGNPSAWTRYMYLIQRGRVSFRWTRYMYLVQRKGFLPLDEVHVPRPSGRVSFRWTRYMYLVQAEGVPSNGRGTCTLSSGRKPFPWTVHRSPGGVPPGGVTSA